MLFFGAAAIYDIYETASRQYLRLLAIPLASNKKSPSLGCACSCQFEDSVSFQRGRLFATSLKPALAS